MLDKMKELFAMQKKMQEIKKQLENTDFEIESSDGLVKVKMNGSQELKDVSINGNLSEINNDKLARALRDTFNRAIKRSQEVAAQKMKDVVGFNIPGL